MQVRTLIVGGVIVALVALARGKSTPQLAKAAPAKAEPVVVSKAAARARIALPEMKHRSAEIDLDIEPAYTEPEDDPDPDAEIVDEPLDDVIESDTYGGVRGQVRDRATGETMPGVTIVASTSAQEGSQAVITDEHGFFELTLLPGSYLVTMYYADTTVAYPLVEVEAGRATLMYARLEDAPYRPVRTFHETIVVDEEDAADEAPADNLAVEFSGGTLLENTYIIE